VVEKTLGTYRMPDAAVDCLHAQEGWRFTTVRPDEALFFEMLAALGGEFEYSAEANEDKHTRGCPSANGKWSPRMRATTADILHA